MDGDEPEKIVRAALARGDLLSAFDEVSRAKELGHQGLKYLEVLTLARLGDTERSLRLYDQYNLADANDADALSLRARLLKDKAFQAGGDPDEDRLIEACSLYAEVYRRTKSNFPAINAATLGRIAGRTRFAMGIARAVARELTIADPTDYYALATLAEAQVVLEDYAGAAETLRRAAAAPDADVGARSTTYLQFLRLLKALPKDAAPEGLLDPIRPPRVAMFCGNIFVGDDELEERLAAEVHGLIVHEKVGFAYGALAAGSDILIAEELLDAGAEVHVVLPFHEHDFIEQSVAPAGRDWIRRYEDCRARAASVTFASSMSYMGDGAQFAYNSKVTMGMARLRARHLNGEAIQIAIVDNPEKTTLSSSDVGAWRNSGGRAVVVTAGELQRPVMPPPPPASPVPRGTHGLMFTDFPGFSSLDEPILPIFWEEVMDRAAQVLDQHRDVIMQDNTWGDALYVVFKDARAAASVALDLSDQFGLVDCGRLGVAEGTAMRIALHYGTTYHAHDPVSRRTTYYGTEVSRTARIEPVTPAGSVYVTEPFAAVLEMEADHPFTCNYVGKTPLAKGYGVYPLYRLARSKVRR